MHYGIVACFSNSIQGVLKATPWVKTQNIHGNTSVKMHPKRREVNESNKQSKATAIGVMWVIIVT